MTLLSGCVVFSIHPLYTVEDLVFEPKLLGMWKEKKDEPPQVDDDGNEKEASSTWVFTKTETTEQVNGENKQVAYYHLNIIEPDGNQAIHDAHMVKIGGEYFINVRTSEEEWEKVMELCEKNKIQAPFVIPVNFFFWVELKEDEMRLRMFDAGWVEKRLEAHPDEISHTIYEDDVLLTAKPAEIQQFIKKHLKTEEAWDKGQVLGRMPINL